MEIYEIHIFVPNTWIYQLADIEYWIINDLTNNKSVLD